MTDSGKSAQLLFSNFYFFVIAVSALFFFVFWGVFKDLGFAIPLIPASISSGLLFIGAVVIRQLLIRRGRTGVLKEQNRMKARFAPTAGNHGDSRHSSKLTIERNAAILDEISRKSDAARVLNKFSAGHREVFDLCREYISRVDGELKTINPNSPRLSALLKGRTLAAEIHKFHLLRWAEIEVTALTDEAHGHLGPEARTDAAVHALDVIDQSLAAYPSEPSLLESRELLQDLVVSIKVSEWIEQAERAEFKGEFAQAKSLYRDALFDLGRGNVNSPTREAAAKHINEEIERLRNLETGTSV